MGYCVDAAWQAWIIIGAVLIVLEILTGTFFILWFGLGALINGALTWFYPEVPIPEQVVIWAAVSLVVAGGGMFWQRSRSNVGLDTDEIIGEVGLLVASATAAKKGRVRFQRPILGSDEWQCTTDEHIEAGSRVRVIEARGDTVHVASV